MGKKSPNKRKSDGNPNTGQTPKKIKIGQLNTEESPQKSITGCKTPKSAQKVNPFIKTPKSAQKFNPGDETPKSTQILNPGNKTPKSAQKLNVQNKTPQSGNKNPINSSNKKQKNKTPKSNKKQTSFVEKDTPKGSKNTKLEKFSGTAQLEGGSNDESGDSDYEVEQIIKPETIRKTMNQFNDSDEDAESSNDGNDVSQETVEDSSGDENESDDDNDVSNEEIENATNENNENGKKANKKKNKDEIAESSVTIEKKLKNFVDSEHKKGPGRYVLFIGNLPYDSTVDEVTEHFSKACKVKHVRLPKDKDSNKPRGFGYIDVEDETSYLKALSLHHSFIKGRRINVLYTTGGKKNTDDRKKFIKSKNMKLNAMRNTGKLGENKNPSQKRSVRRAKKRAFDQAKE